MSDTPRVVPSAGGLSASLGASLRRSLTDLGEQLQQTGVKDGSLAGALIYGGVARGRFVEGRSDVNLLLLLLKSDTDTLARLAEPLRTARRSMPLEPMLVTTAELPKVVTVFPVKFLDIQRRHVVLAGSSQALTSLEVPTAYARLRIEQELRNLAIRSRRHYIERAGNDAAVRQMLAAGARAMAIQLASLLELDGVAIPGDDRTAAIFDLAAQRYRLDRTTLASLASLRNAEARAPITVSADELAALVDRLFETLTAAARVANSTP